jgi:hypothetical protein
VQRGQSGTPGCRPASELDSTPDLVQEIVEDVVGALQIGEQTEPPRSQLREQREHCLVEKIAFHAVTNTRLVTSIEMASRGFDLDEASLRSGLFLTHDLPENCFALFRHA